MAMKINFMHMNKKNLFLSCNSREQQGAMRAHVVKKIKSDLLQCVQEIKSETHI